MPLLVPAPEFEPVDYRREDLHGYLLDDYLRDFWVHASEQSFELAGGFAGFLHLEVFGKSTSKSDVEIITYPANFNSVKLLDFWRPPCDMGNIQLKFGAGSCRFSSQSVRCSFHVDTYF